MTPPDDSIPRYQKVVRDYPELGLPPEGPRETPLPERGLFPPKYEIVALIAETRMSRTWKAIDHDRAAYVVIKEPRDHLLHDADGFRREVQLVAKLTHPNIVPILATELTEPLFFYTMPFVEGLRLDAFCQQRQPGLRDRIELFAKTCRAVAYAHQQGIIHRDLKPGNILVDEDGEPQVLDFGLGAMLEAKAVERPNGSNGASGTPPYMSPEQAEGSSGDTRTDVYALGVVLFEMLAGKTPIEPTTECAEYARRVREDAPLKLRTINPAAPTEIEAIVEKALAKDPGDRYGGVAVLADDVEAFLTGRPVAAVRGGALYRTRKCVRRHAWATTVASMVVLGTIAFTVYAVITWAEHGRAGIAERARILAEHVRRNAEQSRTVMLGRMQTSRGAPLNASRLLWGEFLKQDSPQTRFALYEFYQRYPCEYVAGSSFGPQTQVAYSPDGRWIITIQRTPPDGGRLIAHEASSGHHADTLSAEHAHATSFAFLPDGNDVYVAGTDGHVRVFSFDPQHGRFAPSASADYDAGGLSVQALAFSPDGHWLAVGNDAGHVNTWRRTGGQLEKVAQWSVDGPVSSLAFSPDSSCLAIGAEATSAAPDGRKGGVWASDLNSRNMKGSSGLACRSVLWDGNDQVILAAQLTGEVVAWDVDARSVTKLSERSPWGARGLHTAPRRTGPFLAVADGDGRIRFLNRSSGTWSPIQGYHANGVATDVDVCFSPDGKHVASVGRDGLRVWRFAPAAEVSLPMLDDPDREFYPKWVSADGTILIGTEHPQPPSDSETRPATSSPSPAAPLFRPVICRRSSDRWGVSTGPEYPGAVDAVVVSADGTIVALAQTGVGISRLVITSVLSPDWSGVLTLDKVEVSALQCIDADCRSLLVGTKDGSLLTVRAGSSTPKTITSISGVGYVTDITVSADRQYVAACWEGGNGCGRVRVWQATGQGHPGQSFASAYRLCADFAAQPFTWRIALTRDHDNHPLIATVGSDREVYLWDIPPHEGPRAKLVGHTDAIRFVQPLGSHLLVTSSDDGTVHVWDAANQEEVALLHERQEGPLALSADAKDITIVTRDRVITLTLGDLDQCIAGNREFERHRVSQLSALDSKAPAGVR